MTNMAIKPFATAVKNVSTGTQAVKRAATQVAQGTIKSSIKETEKIKTSFPTKVISFLKKLFTRAPLEQRAKDVKYKLEIAKYKHELEKMQLEREKMRIENLKRLFNF